MFKLSAALKAKGAQAEADFRAWLDWSGVPYLYVEQSPIHVPERLRGALKRPDYIVGVPGVGALAFDVKAKSVYDDCLLFDRAEAVKLGRFARHFHLTTYFACLDAEAPDRHWWVALADIETRTPERRRGRQVLAIPTAQASPVDLTVPFFATLMQVAEHRMQAMAEEA